MREMIKEQNLQRIEGNRKSDWSLLINQLKDDRNGQYYLLSDVGRYSIV